MKLPIAHGVLGILLATPILAQDIPLSKIVIDREGWREVAKDLPGVSYLDPVANGDVHIYQGPLIRALHPDGKITDSPPGKQRPAPSQREVPPYRISKEGKTVERLAEGNPDVLKLRGLTDPSCITLWPEGGHLVIGETDGAYLWAVRIEKDGSFGPGDRYYSLRTEPNRKNPVTAMTMDAGFLLYACTPLGIQVFDPTGRLSGVLDSPTKAPITAATIGGKSHNELFIAAGGRIYARKIQGKAKYTLGKGT